MQSTGSLIPEVKNKPNSIYSFGGLTGAKLTYTRINGATGELVIDENTSDFEFVVTANEVPRGFDTDYKFPIAEEEFYLKVPYQGTDEQTAIIVFELIKVFSPISSFALLPIEIFIPEQILQGP